MNDFSYADAGKGEGLTISRWMPPQRVHRMVQYSDPARPPITRRTANGPLHSGQSDSTVAVAEEVGLDSVSSMGC